jgi:hypothetical protein
LRRLEAAASGLSTPTTSLPIVGSNWMGMFPNLSLTHLIPSRRVQPDYLLRLYEETRLSEMKMAAGNGRAANPIPLGVVATLRHYLGQLRRGKFERGMRAANRRASQRFRKWLRLSS